MLSRQTSIPFADLGARCLSKLPFCETEEDYVSAQMALRASKKLRAEKWPDVTQRVIFVDQCGRRGFGHTVQFAIRMVREDNSSTVSHFGSRRLRTSLVLPHAQHVVVVSKSWSAAVDCARAVKQCNPGVKRAGFLAPLPWALVVSNKISFARHSERLRLTFSFAASPRSITPDTAVNDEEQCANAKMDRSGCAECRWYLKPSRGSLGKNVMVTPKISIAEAKKRLCIFMEKHGLAVAQQEIFPPMLMRTSCGAVKFDVRLLAIVTLDGRVECAEDARIKCAATPYADTQTTAHSCVTNQHLQETLHGTRHWLRHNPMSLRSAKHCTEDPQGRAGMDGEALYHNAVRVLEGTLEMILKEPDVNLVVQQHVRAGEFGMGVFGADIGFDAAGRAWIIEINKQPMPFRSPKSSARLYQRFDKWLADAVLKHCVIP